MDVRFYCSSATHLIALSVTYLLSVHIAYYNCAVQCPYRKRHIIQHTIQYTHVI